MRSVESSAKTMEEAVTQGLEKLGVSFADVKIDILDEGSKGFLGILGGKPVVVRLTVREDVEEGEDLLSSVALEDAGKEPEQKPARKRASRSKAEKPAKEAKPGKSRCAGEGEGGEFPQGRETGKAREGREAAQGGEAGQGGKAGRSRGGGSAAFRR